MLICTIM